jgi:hypothetical protein
MNWWSLFFIPVISLLFLSCAPNRKIIFKNKKIVSDKLFQLNLPENDWGYSLEKQNLFGERSGTIRDMLLVSCPGPFVITISRGAYRQAFFDIGKEDSESFLKFSEKYINDFYKKTIEQVPHEIISIKPVQISTYTAVEAIVETVRTINLCNKDSSIVIEKTKYWEKFILIQGGDKGTFFDMGLSTARMVVFSYIAPPEMFNQKVGEFDKMIQSFEFIKK